MSLIDSHCHLDYLERRGHEVSAVIAEAEQAGVTRFLTVATTVAGDATLSGYCAQYSQVMRSVGVHPNHAHEEPHIRAEDIIALSKADGVVAIGETGLDYFRGDQHKDIQKRLFSEQILAAQETGLPLIIHTRAADEDTVAMMTEHYTQKPFRGVFHCYVGSEMIRKAAEEMDFYISVTGVLTYKNAPEIRAQMPNVALNRLMVETDAPFLAPVPHRGQECQPFMVADTARFLAEQIGVDEQTLAERTTENFYRLFTRAAS